MAPAAIAALNLEIKVVIRYKEDNSGYREDGDGPGQPESKGGATPLVGVENPCLRFILYVTNIDVLSVIPGNQQPFYALMPL